MLTISHRRLIRLDQFALGGLCGCCATSTQICLQVVCTPNTIPIIGATIQLWSGSTLVASCTTPNSGCCTFAESGTYTVKVVISGSTVYSASKTLSGTTIDIVLSAASASVVCCSGYAIPTTLTLTDAIGSLSLVYETGSSPPTWTTGHAATKTSCTATIAGGICTVASPTTGPVRVCYQMACLSSSPHFELQRSWSWVDYFSGGVYVPTWYQDSTGFTPGSVCVTGPPASCGSPNTDAANDLQNPTGTAPFAISFTPAAVPGNQTADPVGGTVAISA